jgi:hypothetical protein
MPVVRRITPALAGTGHGEEDMAAVYRAAKFFFRFFSVFGHRPSCALR